MLADRLQGLQQEQLPLEDHEGQAALRVLKLALRQPVPVRW